MFSEEGERSDVCMLCYVLDDAFGHYQTVRHHAGYVVSVMLLSCYPVCSPYQAMWGAEISNRTRSGLSAFACNRSDAFRL